MAPSLFLLVFWILLPSASTAIDSFNFAGFHSHNLRLDGGATVTPDGLLRLTNASKIDKAHAFFPSAVRFRTSPASRDVLSFSTTFAFGIQATELIGHGIVFFLSSSTNFSSAAGSQFFGLFEVNNKNPNNHVLGVELDTTLNNPLGDINANHVGIDVNSPNSIDSSPAGYFSKPDSFHNLTLSSGKPMQVWVDYNGKAKRMDVILAPLGKPKPQIPLLSTVLNLSTVVQEFMFVGFASATSHFHNSHYVLGWSHNMSGEAKLDTSSLPSLPPNSQDQQLPMTIWLPITVLLTVISISGV